jgi:hypothetical protein
MKTRQSIRKSYTESYRYYYLDGSQSQLFSEAPYLEQPEFYEFIDSGSGKKLPNGYPKMNHCDHIKYLFRPMPQARNWRFTFSSGTIRQYANSPVNWNYGPSVVPTVRGPAINVDQFIRRGFQATRPKFQANLSLPNALYELKDLKRLIPDKRTIESYASALAAVPSNPFRKSAKALERMNHAVASQYLNAQFGYLSMIRDFGNLASSIKEYNVKLYNLIKYANTIQTGHYAEEVVEYYEDRVYHDSGPVKYVRQVQYGKTVWVFTWKYRYKILSPKLFPPKIFLKYLGFRDNPRILWDAIPFSFVLDWFLKFGKALESLDDGAIPVTIEILGACISYRYPVTITGVVSDRPGSWGGSYNLGTDYAQFVESYDVYRRWPVELSYTNLVDIKPLPVTDKLSVKELTLGIALGKTLTS